MHDYAFAPLQGPPTHAHPPLDPVFAAAQRLDRAADEWSAAHVVWTALMGALDPRGLHDWGDSAAVARAAFGPLATAVAHALDLAERRLADLGQAENEALMSFMSTKPTSEIGVAAYRAAARRYARRPGNSATDEVALLDRLGALLAA